MLFAVLSAILLPAVPAIAQIDIPITSIGPNRDIARNVTWAGSGTAAVNNSYLFTPTWTNEGACVFITNNDTVNIHAFNLTLLGTGDQSVRSYQGNTAKWALLGPVANLPTGGGGTTLLPTQTKNYFVQVSGQSSVAIVIANASGTSTVTVTMVESQNGVGCGNTTAGPIYCPITISATVASGVTLSLLNSQPTQSIYVCNAVFTSASAAGGADTISVLAGTGVTCGTSTVTTFSISVPAGVAINFNAYGNPLIGRFTASVDNIGSAICIFNNAGTPIAVDLTVAQF